MCSFKGLRPLATLHQLQTYERGACLYSTWHMEGAWVLLCKRSHSKALTVLKQETEEGSRHCATRQQIKADQQPHASKERETRLTSFTRLLSVHMHHSKVESMHCTCSQA